MIISVPSSTSVCLELKKINMELFPISDSEVQKIYEKYDTNKDKIEEGVKILEEWMKKQPHFPQKLQYDHFLERALSNNKFRIEKAKEKIEKHFTLKNANKEFYELFESDQFILPSNNVVSLMPLPKLGPELERIYVAELTSPDFSTFNISHLIQATLSLQELRYKYDKTNSMRLIVDCGNSSFDFVKKIDVAKLHRMAHLKLDAYTCKIEAFDLINANPAVQFVINILKVVVKDKVIQKIRYHSNLESLHRSVPKEYLPEHLGGTAGSIDDTRSKMDDIISDHRKMIADSVNYAANESLRVGPCAYNYMHGVDGTFKKLSLD